MKIRIVKISNLIASVARRASAFLVLTALACSTASAVVNFASPIDENTTYLEITSNLNIDVAIADLDFSEPVDLSQVIAAENLWITIPGVLDETTLQAEFGFYTPGSGAAVIETDLLPLTALGGSSYGFDSSINSFVASQFALTNTDNIAIRVFEPSGTIFTTNLVNIPADSGDFAGLQFGGNLTVVPEPSTFAVLAGALVMGFVALNRRNQKQTRKG